MPCSAALRCLALTPAVLHGACDTLRRNNIKRHTHQLASLQQHCVHHYDGQELWHQVNFGHMTWPSSCCGQGETVAWCQVIAFLHLMLLQGIHGKGSYRRHGMRGDGVGI